MTAGKKETKFKKPISLEASIYTDEQSFNDLEDIKRWAAASKKPLDDQRAILVPYFGEAQAGAFVKLFILIEDIIGDYEDVEARPKRSLTAVRNEIEKLLNKMLVPGLTFASPSEVLTITINGGRYPYFYAGFYSVMFELVWQMPAQNFSNLIAQSLFHQGIHAATFFENRKATNIAAVERVTQTKLASSSSRIEAIVEEGEILANELSTRIEVLKAEESKLDKQLKSAIKKRLKQHYKLRRLYKADIVEAKTDHDNQVQGIQDAFSSHIALEEPAKYWKTRANNSRWAAIGFGLLFVLAGCLFIYLAFLQGPKLYGTMTEQAGDNGLSLIAVAVFTFPVIVGLWMLKSAARLFVENLHFHQDASYRHMMITTYLSMLQDPLNPITPEERVHALKTIFSTNLGQATPITLPTDRILGGR